MNRCGKGKRIFGAVAYLKTDAYVQAYAERQGLFVIRATGKSASIITGQISGPGCSADRRLCAYWKVEDYQALFKKAKRDQLCGDISPDYLYFYHNAVPKILNEINAQAPVIIILRNPIDRAYSNYLHHVREGWEKLSFEDALDAEGERRSANWTWGWSYVDVGLYAEQVKAYMDNFERVLLLLFEEDIVTGRATGKVLKFLNLDPFPEDLDEVHVNVSGYPQNRVLHRLMTDELVVRKIKNVVKATPLYAGSKRVFRKVMEGNLRKEEMGSGTRRMLKEKFQDDVALLADYTGLPVYEFWSDFR